MHGVQGSGKLYWQRLLARTDGSCRPVFLYLFLESFMSNVPPVSGGADAAIAKMEAAFDKAIETSARVTEITTEKKAELDAAKQRPQN